MRLSSILKVVLLASTVCLVSCHTKKQVIKDPQPPTTEEIEQIAFLEKVNSNTQKGQFVTSKLKFTVEYGPQQISLTGNLKMKRNDVIQLQLMAFGFVEAGRLEFTKDYVLIIDRINKQFLKVPYNYVDFLRNSGINFFTLQALFWNELFKPGQEGVGQDVLANYTTTDMGNNEVVINLDEGKMSYSWLTDKQSAQIKMANISYRDSYRGNSQLSWEYREFSKLGSKLFPSDNAITLTTTEKELKLGVKLNYLGTDSEWDSRTKVSDKYKEVDIDTMLRRFMAL